MIIHAIIYLVYRYIMALIHEYIVAVIDYNAFLFLSILKCFQDIF